MKAEQKDPGSALEWWRRVSVTTVANCCGTLIAGGMLGFFTILWTKAGKADENETLIIENFEAAETKHKILLQELAILRAESDKKDKQLEDFFSNLDVQIKDAGERISRYEEELKNLAKNDNPYRVDYSIPDNPPIVQQVSPKPRPIPLRDAVVQENIAHQKPSVVEVLEAQEMIQQKIDKAEFRRRNK